MTTTSELRRIIRAYLYESVGRFLDRRAVVTSGAPIFWEPSDAGRRAVADLVVRFGSRRPVAAWRTWELGVPDLVVDVGGRRHDGASGLDERLEAYRQAGVRELVAFNPSDAVARLRLWDRVRGDWVERRSSDPEFRRCDALALYWCVLAVPGIGPTLRLARDRRGRDLLLTPAEHAERERRARKMARVSAP